MQRGLSPENIPAGAQNGSANKIAAGDRAIHDWYRFVLSFPPHLVRNYISRFGLRPGHLILDPFCGTGTTLIEARRQGIASVGFEANPLAHFASSTKMDWSPDPDRLTAHATRVAELAQGSFAELGREPLRTLPEHLQGLLLKNSISALPLHKALALLENLRSLKDDRYYPHELLALAKTLVFSASNLQFGPEVGVSRKKKRDAPVVEVWLNEVRAIADDLRSVQQFPATRQTE